MRFLDCSDIIVKPDRQRQYFDPDALAELSEGIARVGLIHAIVVGEDNVLDAGERRLKVVSNLHFLGTELRYDGQVIPPGKIPCVLPSEADAVTRYEIELQENLNRSNITWQEQAEATNRLAALRAQQRTEAGMTPPTVADIAEEVEGRRDGYYQDKTRKSLAVAKHLADPEIARAKSVDDAFKILKKRETAKMNEERATAVGTVATTSRIQLLNTDSIKWMSDALAEEGGARFDVICTDPPYGMDAQAFGDAGGSYVGVTHDYKDDAESWLALMTDFARLSYQIAKANAHLYAACDIDGFHTLKRLLSEAGWRVHRTPLVCRKLDANRVPWPEQGPRRCYELVLYAVKGGKPTTAIYDDVFETTGDENLGHGAQKPVDFWRSLLKRSVRPGDHVLDPFAGTCGIIVAAHELSAYCTALERETPYYGIGLKRLEGLK